MIYQTGFGNPPFTTGNLVGQDGWGARGDYSPNAARVMPNDGGQLVEIVGPTIQQIQPDFYAGFYVRNVSFDPLGSGEPLLNISADFRLDLGPNATRPGFLFAFLSFVDENNARYGSVGVDQSGVVFGQNLASSNAVVAAPVNGAGAFHNLRVSLDFNTRQMTFFMNSVAFGTTAFNETVGTRLGAIDLILQSSNPIDSTLYADNLVVEAVPEPSAMIMLSAGVGGVLSAAMRRRRRPKALDGSPG